VNRRIKKSQSAPMKPATVRGNKYPSTNPKERAGRRGRSLALFS
jgi:hypothetical protein